ncbi:DNA/RNA-binding protein AlbA [Candidatus Bathyarchaeota archaeon]|nr:DNA/RNA-binding protein AlbA [Candidatus Bathyarchaeota archaeon]
MSRPKRNLVIMGSKPIMNYVVACLTLFNEGAETVKIRARGKHINKAADTVGLLRRVFLPNLRVVEAETGTDVLTRTDGNQAHVSILEIVIAAN